MSDTLVLESEIQDQCMVVKTFGGFSITYKGNEISFGQQNESQIVHLLQLLLHFRVKGVSRDLAKAELFGDRDVDDVSHSIRNIIYNLRKKLREMGKKVRVVMGFNTKDEVFGEEAFIALGCETTVCTMDGSSGIKGVVTDVIEKPAPYYYACGPLPMIKAILRTIGTNGQISMEERMGCGVGICVGCTIETREGFKRVCKEGPVFLAEDLVERS